MDGDVVTGEKLSLAPDDERVPSQKRSLEPDDDGDGVDSKKSKTDDCQFCTFDNKVKRLRDPRKWRILPAVVYDVLALIKSGGKRVFPADDGAGKQQQHQVNHVRLIIRYLPWYVMYLRVMSLLRLILLVASFPEIGRGKHAFTLLSVRRTDSR